MQKGLSIFLAVFLSATAAWAAQDSALVPMADGFDFPVGKPDAAHYHKARGFQPNGHLGEDWNGDNGGDSDLGDAVCAIGNGIVVFARDVQLGWGNVVILRHAFYENGQLKVVDSLYGHLNQITVSEGQMISRGERLGTIGSNHGMYAAHLHLEIRKNLEIGMNRAAFARDFSNYYDPTEFIRARRSLATDPNHTSILIATNTFSTQPQHYTAPADEAILSPARSAQARTSKPEMTLVKRAPFKVDRFSDLR